MLRKPVTSTTMHAIGYDEDRRLLEIEFHTGKIYVYRKVPVSVYLLLMQAASKGKYFNEHIRDVFPFNEVFK